MGRADDRPIRAGALADAGSPTRPQLHDRLFHGTRSQAVGHGARDQGGRYARASMGSRWRTRSSTRPRWTRAPICSLATSTSPNCRTSSISPRAPTMNPSPRSFVLPLIGLTLLFAALGPAIGGAMFVPLAVVLKPPVGGRRARAVRLGRRVVRAHDPFDCSLCRRRGAGRGDRIPLCPVGRRGPGAMAARARRFDHRRRGCLRRLARLASIAASVDLTIEGNVSGPVAEWIDATLSGTSKARSPMRSSPAAPSRASSAPWWQAFSG